ncbi:MAG: CotH kinase family protein [Bryobacteraceae bacterium]|nr:CotH kinase family protein [Bryobacteraceae bacterium]
MRATLWMLALLAWSLPAQAQPAYDPAEGSGLTLADFLDDKVTHEIRITINAKDLKALQDNFRDNTYYPANFSWRGITVENVGIRSKGRTSRRAGKPGLRVDLNRFEDQEFFGRKSFLLDNNIPDFTMMKERIAMEVYRRMGLPAPRETHCRLYINNEYFGVYTLIEATDKKFLRQWLDDDEGYLYEWEYLNQYRFQYLGDNPSLYSPIPFKPETNEKNQDAKPLEAMIRTINEASDADFVTAVSEYLDLKQFLSYLAVELYLSEYDGFLSEFGVNNLYFYRYDKKNLGLFIPKDRDNTFNGADFPVLKYVGDNVLAKRALAVPELKKHLTEELLRVASLCGGPGGWLDQEIDRIYALIQEDARKDAKKECPEGPCSVSESNDVFQRFIDFIKEFPKNRRSFVVKELKEAGYPLPSEVPGLEQGAVSNAAMEAAESVAPGSLAAVKGSGFGTEPSELTVLVGGVAAPVQSVTAGKLVVQVPWETRTGVAPLVVIRNGIRSEQINIKVETTAPAIFFVLNEAGERVKGEKPAAPGDVVTVIATGLGEVANRPETGAPAPAEPAATLLDTPAVLIGGVPADVLSAALEPGAVGRYRVAVRVPGGVAPGAETPVVIQAGGVASPAHAIAIR